MRKILMIGFLLMVFVVCSPVAADFITAPAIAYEPTPQSGPETELDILLPDAQETCTDGAIIRAGPMANSGTGIWNPFLTTLSSKVDADGIQEGINNGEALNTDMETDHWTSDRTKLIQLKDVPVDPVLTGYRRFDLDANEAGASKFQYLSLGMVRIYVGPMVTGDYDPEANPATYESTTLVWDLDNACAEENDLGAFVAMDYRLAPGSGWSDLNILIPESAFDGKSDDDYVYMYTRFADPATFNTPWPVVTDPDWGPIPSDANLLTNDGFEEWRLLPVTSTEPTTLRLQKIVDSGSLQPADWDLTATPPAGAAGGFTDKGDSTTFHPVTAGIWYTLSESDNPAGYSTNGVWVCDAGTMDGNNKVGLLPGESATCVIHNYFTPNVPEFPSVALPVGMIIGFVGMVLFVRGTKEN